MGYAVSYYIQQTALCHYLNDGFSPASDVLSDNYSTFTPGISETTGAAGGGFASEFYLADASGHNRGMLNGSNTDTDGYNWDAFGNLVSRFGSNPTMFAWNEEAGYQTDNDDGLALLGNRYYDKRTGRFISQDPIGDGGNWYAHADNDPMNETDPDGLDAQPIPPDWNPIFGPPAQPSGYDPNTGLPYWNLPGGIVEQEVPSPAPPDSSPPDSGPGGGGGSGSGDSGTSDADMGFGGWVDQNVTMGLVAASARDWDSNPGRAGLELAGASALVVGTAIDGASLASGGLKVLAKTGCFTAGTPVQMEEGSTPIQDILTGELVATRNLQTNQTEYRRVTRTFQHLAHDTIMVEFADAKTGQVVGMLTATPEHPFYVPGEGMTALGKLGIGTLVVTRAGPSVVVHSLVRQHSAPGVMVYNIEVEGDHTYFVGNANGGEWVHNLCGIYDILLASGKRYIGQSKDIARRLAQHVYAKKITAAEASRAIQIAVAGSKADREVAEQTLIDSYGGIAGQNTTNKFNPVGDARIGLMGSGYTRP